MKNVYRQIEIAVENGIRFTDWVRLDQWPSLRSFTRTYILYQGRHIKHKAWMAKSLNEPGIEWIIGGSNGYIDYCVQVYILAFHENTV